MRAGLCLGRSKESYLIGPQFLLNPGSPFIRRSIDPRIGRTVSYGGGEGVVFEECEDSSLSPHASCLCFL